MRDEDLDGWPALRAHVTETQLEVRVLTERLLHVTIAQGRGRLDLRLRLEASPSGSPWVMLVAQVCTIRELRARAALVANRTLPIGALAMLNEWIVLRQALPLRPAFRDGFDRALHSFGELVTILRTSCRSGDADAPYAYLFQPLRP
jgi:hypothetical protein